MNRPVAKGKRRETGDVAPIFQRLQISAQGDAAQYQNSSRPQHFQFANEIGLTIVKLGGKRLIGGRSTAGGGRDVCVVQYEAVTAIKRRGLIGESCRVHCPVQEISGTIAGEHSSGSIGTVSRRRKAEYQQASSRVSEAGHRFAPILPIEECAAFFAGHCFAIAHQARAFPAGDNFFVNLPQRIQFVFLS